MKTNLPHKDKGDGDKAQGANQRTEDKKGGAQADADDAESIEWDLTPKISAQDWNILMAGARLLRFNKKGHKIIKQGEKINSFYKLKVFCLFVCFVGLIVVCVWPQHFLTLLLRKEF